MCRLQKNTSSKKMKVGARVHNIILQNLIKNLPVIIYGSICNILSILLFRVK